MLGVEFQLPAGYQFQQARYTFGDLLRPQGDDTVVIEHTGWPRDDSAAERRLWQDGMRALAEVGPMVMCKLSGVTTEADHASWTRDQLRPYIDHVIDSFGFNRIMFGGDWPVSELAGKYTDWLEVLDWATSGCTR